MNRRTSVRTTLVGLMAVGFVLAALGAAGLQEVGTTFSMPAKVQGTATASGCSNAPGPTITLAGEVALGGLGVELVFENNLKGTHTLVVQSTGNVVLVPAGQSVAIPKQPVDGGVGGNPFIFVQFVDAEGNALSQAYYLGRCVQGLFNVASDLTIPAAAVATITAGQCDNSGGPYVTLSGELTLGGINARLYFTNNDNPVGGPHQASVLGTVDVVVLPQGQSIQIPKQPVLGGVGGNPIILLGFLDGKGNLMGTLYTLGRCNQI